MSSRPDRVASTVGSFLRRGVLATFAAWVALAGMARESSGGFYTQVIQNQLALGMNASGVNLNFTNKNVYIQVKVKDRNGGKSAGMAIVQGTNNWQLAGNLKSLNVVADPPPPPFRQTSFADVYWQNNNVNSQPIQSGKWVDNTNAILGAVTLVGGVVGITMKDFNVAALDFQNPGNTALVFTNIQVYENQNLLNYNIDDFTSFTGTAVTLPDITVGPNSDTEVDLMGNFSTNGYQLVLADVYESGGSPSEALGIGTGDILASVPEPTSFILVASGVGSVFFFARRRREVGGVKSSIT